jgi:hypothetical protein
MATNGRKFKTRARVRSKVGIATARTMPVPSALNYMDVGARLATVTENFLK